MKDETTTTDLIALPAAAPAIATLFSKPENVDAILREIEAKVAGLVPDTSTNKGRDEIRSMAAKVARSKTALDKAGKDLNEEARARIAAVDAERRKIRDHLDALKESVRKPLTDWEDAEQRRVDNFTARVSKITANGFSALTPSATIKARIAELEALTIDETWREFEEKARFALDVALTTLRAHLEASEQREKDERELEALRREKAEREAKEAAERAERERIEREKAEALRREQKAKEQAEREAKEKAAREQFLIESIETHIADVREGLIGGQPQAYGILLYELEQKMPLEIGRLPIGSESARLQNLCDEARKFLSEQAEEQAQKEAERADLWGKELAREAAQKAKEEAKLAAEEERKRIEAEQAKAEAEREKRERSKRIRKEKAAQIATALKGVDPFTPEAIAEALLDKKIPNVSVEF